MGGQPGARRPVGEHPRPVHGARPRRGLRVHRPGDQHPRADVRHGAHVLRDRGAGRRRRRDLRARPQRADLHLPAADGLRDRRPRGRDRGRLAAPGVHPGRPLPVQREEVRGRPRGDDRGDPAGLPARDRRRLPQHRHRQLDARRPLEARPRRGAARELRPRGRAHGAHPEPRDRRRHVSVGGEIGEVGKQNSTAEELRGVPRRLRPRAGDGGRPARSGLSKVSVQTGTSHGGVPLPGGGVAEVKLDFEVLRELGEIARALRAGGRGPARRVDAARRAVPPLPGGRDGRDPPRDGLPERALRAPRVPGRRCMDEIYAWCEVERRRRAQGRPDRRAVPVHDAQEGDRAVQAAAVGPRRPRTRSSRPRAPSSGSCSPSCGSTARWSWSSATSGRCRCRGRSPSRSPSRSRAEPRRDDGRRRRPVRVGRRRAAPWRSRSASRRPTTNRASARSSWRPSAVPRRPRSSTGSAPMRRTAGGRWSPSAPTAGSSATC